MRSAQRVINVMRTAVSQMTKNGASIDYSYGYIDSGGSYAAGAYMSGDLTGEPILVTMYSGMYLQAGDYAVIAMDDQGDAWVQSLIPVSPYFSAAFDPIRGRLIVTADTTLNAPGSVEPSDPGIYGQTLHSGGPYAPMYWDY